MRLTIDTQEDSHESIQATIQLLQSHLKSKGVNNYYTNVLPEPTVQNGYNQSSESSSQSYGSYTSIPVSDEERLAKKIAKAKMRQESYSSSEPVDSAPAMSMFDSPEPTVSSVSDVSSEAESDESDDVRLIPY